MLGFGASHITGLTVYTWYITFSSNCLYLPELLTASTSLSNTIAHLILHHLDANLICPSPIYLGSICIPFTRTISLGGFLFLLAPLMMWVTKSSKSTSPYSILWHFLDPWDATHETKRHLVTKSHEVSKHQNGAWNNCINLKYDRNLGSIAAEMPVKFQSDWTPLNPYLAALRVLGVRHLTV